MHVIFSLPSARKTLPIFSFYDTDLFSKAGNCLGYFSFHQSSHCIFPFHFSMQNHTEKLHTLTILYTVYIYIYICIYIYIYIYIFFFTNFACPHMTPKMGFVTVACESLGTPCRICENVNNFNKIREIIQNACYFLFSTVLSKTFYIKYVYI